MASPLATNDLTQLTLGLDRDSGLIASQFDERNEAVKILLHQLYSLQKSRQIYRHLRSRAIRSPRFCSMADE